MSIYLNSSTATSHTSFGWWRCSSRWSTSHGLSWRWTNRLGIEVSFLSLSVGRSTSHIGSDWSKSGSGCSWHLAYRPYGSRLCHWDWVGAGLLLHLLLLHWLLALRRTIRIENLRICRLLHRPWHRWSTSLHTHSVWWLNHGWGWRQLRGCHLSYLRTRYLCHVRSDWSRL